ncbi:MAG TPA: hypothetical protein VLK84_20120 [Longimicrobium sp.]|nr:hypothetical protein [Longimicrobium sp.]
MRILAPSVADSLLTGTVTGIDSTSLLFAPPASATPQSIALRDIERLEVRGPGAPRTLPGALLGMVAGAVVGYGACHAISGSPHANCPKDKGALYGGAAGLLLGALLGSELRGRHRWHPAVAPQR